MSFTADSVRTLHRILRQKTDLESRLSRGPKQIAFGEGNVTRCEEELKTTKDLARKTRMEADEKQLQLRQRESRVNDLQGKLNASTNNKEYQALKEQIAADNQANAVLSDEILELLEKLDKINLDIKAVEEKVRLSNEDLTRIRQKVLDEKAGLESQLARVTAELEEAETMVPAEMKVDYNRVVKARGESALAAVEGDTCGNCYQTISPRIMDNLRMERPVFCAGCGSLMYLKDSIRRG